MSNRVLPLGLLGPSFSIDFSRCGVAWVTGISSSMTLEYRACVVELVTSILPSGTGEILDTEVSVRGRCLLDVSRTVSVGRLSPSYLAICGGYVSVQRTRIVNTAVGSDGLVRAVKNSRLS